MHITLCTLRQQTVYMGGRGCTKTNSVCFTKNWVKLGAFPNATLTSKNLEKFVSGQKRSKTPQCMGGAGRFVQNRPKENKNLFNMSTACLLRKIDAQYKHTNISPLFTKAFYQCLHNNLALLCGFVCDRKMSPEKISQCRSQSHNFK